MSTRTPNAVESLYSRTVKQLLSFPVIQEALLDIQKERPFAIAEQVRLCEIPAPTFHEQVRAANIVRRMKKYGFDEVRIDEIGNVVARYRGTDSSAPTVALGAHMDTVFPEGTDCHVRQEGTVYYGPGIGDNCAGLRALLQVMRTLKKFDIRTRGDLVFVGTVGEEGNGDIRGSKHLFRHGLATPIDGFIAIDNTNVGRILYGAVGSHRYRFTVRGPGGHSFGAFGSTPSAIHAICLAGAKVAHIQVPKDPKTTFTIGTMAGGTSVNTIAARAHVDVDIRSLDMAALLKTEQEIMAAFEAGVAEENTIWGVTDTNAALRLRVEKIGDRPAGLRPDSCPVLQSCRAAQAILSIPLTHYMHSSTDANMPMSLGIPSTCLSAGGTQARTHTVDEYFDATNSYLGPQLIFLSALLLVGTARTQALLPRRVRA